MPTSKGKKAKKTSVNLKQKNEAQLPLKKSEAKIEVPQAVSSLVESLANSPWQSHSSRPKGATFGYYMICKWFPRNKGWAVLYLGRGWIRTELDHHFSGRGSEPINAYLSSFPRASRKLLWIKWVKDDFYPYEGHNIEALIKAVQHLYNNGVRPAFNLTDKEDMGDVPENFSILD